jgi:hypothetical protein
MDSRFFGYDEENKKPDLKSSGKNIEVKVRYNYSNSFPRRQCFEFFSGRSPDLQSLLNRLPVMPKTSQWLWLPHDLVFSAYSCGTVPDSHGIPY